MTRPVLHVRFLPDFVGETRRVVHVVPAPDGGAVPDELEALCGQRIKPGEAELMAPFAGMPCTTCVIASATPAPELPATTEPASS